MRSTPALAGRWPRGPRERRSPWRSSACGPARERTGRSAMPFALPPLARLHAILARRGPCNVAIYTRTNTPADGGSICARRKPGLFLDLGPDGNRPHEKAPLARDLPESRAPSSETRPERPRVELRSRVGARDPAHLMILTQPFVYGLQAAAARSRRQSSSSYPFAFFAARVRPVPILFSRKLELGQFSSVGLSASE